MSSCPTFSRRYRKYVKINNLGWGTTVKISKLSLILPIFLILFYDFDRRAPTKIILFTYFRNLLEKCYTNLQ